MGVHVRNPPLNCLVFSQHACMCCLALGYLGPSCLALYRVRGMVRAPF